jgi:hypothetical protein
MTPIATVLALTVGVLAQTHQSYGIKKYCADVPKETQEQISTKAEDAAKEGESLGAVSKILRTWVKDQIPATPEACTVEIVREVVKRRDEAVKVKTETEKLKKQEAEATANKQAWDRLNDIQKRWLVYSRDVPGSKELDCSPFTIGKMGSIKDLATVINVISPTEAIVNFGCRFGHVVQVPDSTAWITGIETSNLVSGGTFDAPKGIFWIPKTKTYPTAIGGSNTVWYLEPVAGASDISNINPPANAKLSDFDPPTTNSTVFKPP